VACTEEVVMCAAPYLAPLGTGNNPRNLQAS
jgi:hypothetical protein